MRKSAVPEYISQTSSFDPHTTKGLLKQTPNNPSKKKSAVPEYIWYISLIIISITLVVGIINITKKSNKNINPPSQSQVQLDIIIDPNNVVKLKDLNFVGTFDLEKDTPSLYLCCGGSCGNLMKILNATSPTDILVRKADGSIGLKKTYGIIIYDPNTNSSDGNYNLIKATYPPTCFQKGAVWQLYYGNPNEGGVLLATDKVNRLVEFN